MLNTRLFKARQNLLVAAVRVILSAFALVAVLVDPDKPIAGTTGLIAAIMAGYFIASLALGAVAHFWKDRYETLVLPTFGLDMTVATVILYLSGGATNPFFPLLVVSATLEWGWKGAVWATALVLIAFIPPALDVYRRFNQAAIDPQLFIIRVGNQLVIGGMMAVFGRHEERFTRDMRRLSSARLQPKASERPPVAACLEYATMVFGLGKGVFIWGDPEEPGLTISELGPAGFRESSWPLAGTEDHPVLDGVTTPFVFDPRAPEAPDPDTASSSKEPPSAILAGPILRHLVDTPVLVLPVKATAFAGWIILQDIAYLEREALVLGSTVAAQAALAMESWTSLVAWRDAAAAEERVRIARDLHDGTLQFLAGTAMQLEGVKQQLGPDQDQAKEQIHRLQDDLRAEQKQLRELITSSGAPADDHSRGASFQDEVQRLSNVLARRWNAAISVEVDPEPRRLPAKLVFELLQLVREAVSNAVRHGQASLITITAGRCDTGFALTIADNGVGMASHGVFNMDDLHAMGLGPRTLLGRVAGLGGDLAIETAPGGTRLRITTPIPQAGGKS